MARISIVVGLIWLCIGTLLPFTTFAETYPVRPIRIVVGFQPGGAVDLAARVIAKELTESLGQSVIVDNRSGAGGNIAADIVAKSAPDGYTLLMAPMAIAVPSIFTKLSYDINKDLAPVSLVAIGPSILVTQTSFPVNNVKELITLAKAKPGQLTNGSPGLGGATHLLMELFTAMAGIKVTIVHYKGGVPSVTALLSKEVDMIFTSIPSVLSQIRAGKVKPLGVSSKKRSSVLPNVPSIDESGLPGFDAASWYGLFAPTGISNDKLGILSKEIVKVMRVQGVRDNFTRDGFEPLGSSPQEFSEFLREEIPKWEKVVKAAGIKVQ
jgi:tripartite-type tricarboxylate transporter receptor subunit TctC